MPADGPSPDLMELLKDLMLIGMPVTIMATGF